MFKAISLVSLIRVAQMEGGLISSQYLKSLSIKNYILSCLKLLRAEVYSLAVDGLACAAGGAGEAVTGGMRHGPTSTGLADTMTEMSNEDLALNPVPN